MNAHLFEAVIFDMDGTLADTTQADYQAWKRLFADYGKSLSFDQYIPLLGIKSAVVAREFLPLHHEAGLQEALARKLRYFEDTVNLSGVSCIPAADDFLEQVLKYPVKVALATSSRRAKMEMVMKRLEFFGHFEAIVSGEEVQNSKPAPDVFLLAAQKLGVAPARCLVFEDAVLGVQAAKNAGMKCVAIEAAHTKGLLHEADKVVDGYVHLDFQRLLEELA